LSQQIIKLGFQNGLRFQSFVKEVFEIEGLEKLYKFEETENPDFIIFGPYGNDIPAKGNYTRIGYYCENFDPDFSICDWSFGVPAENNFNNPTYRRIQWHGLNPKDLVKNIDVEKEFNNKTNFCCFLYSNLVSYREAFFKQLSVYKKVDAPGKSMNNMGSIDDLYTGTRWEIKRQFISSYKFTVAFENYAYPGYQTEKLYDAMLSNSIPIYCGDPNVTEVFNPKSFINVFDHLKTKKAFISKFLEKSCQSNFKDYRPGIYNNLIDNIIRKIKIIGKEQKMRLQLNNFDFRPLIDIIAQVDNNDELYKQMLAEPWFTNNKVPSNFHSKARWVEIFESSLKKVNYGKAK